MAVSAQTGGPDGTERSTLANGIQQCSFDIAKFHFEDPSGTYLIKGTSGSRGWQTKYALIARKLQSRAGGEKRAKFGHLSDRGVCWGVMKRRMGELELIETIRAGIGRRSSQAVALGIGDDCAVLRPPKGHEVLVTTDFSLEGRHFRRDWHPADSVGHRALARGLSDIGAMGAKPQAGFLSLAMPAEMMGSRAGRHWVKQFLQGLGRLAEEFSVPLAGGDTSQAPGDQVLVDIVLVGSTPRGRSLRRSGGRVGDMLYVTGALGGAAVELAGLAAGKRRRGSGHPHLYPVPRVRVGLELVRRRLASAAIDLSDGLSTDLAHLCKESRVGAEVWQDRLPLGAGAKLEQALHGGEDYELLFAAPARVKVPAVIAGTAVTPVGRLVRGSGIWLVDRDGERRRLKPGGWEHFRAIKGAGSTEKQ